MGAVADHEHKVPSGPIRFSLRYGTHLRTMSTSGAQRVDTGSVYSPREHLDGLLVTDYLGKPLAKAHARNNESSAVAHNCIKQRQQLLEGQASLAIPTSAVSGAKMVVLA